MIIKDDELKSCLLFALRPYMNEYDFHIIQSDLSIDERIYLDALMKYQSQSFRIQVYFILKYKKNSFIFDNIEGKVKYSFIELPFMQVFKQFIKIPKLEINDHQCSYPFALPIENIELAHQQLIVHIKK